MSTIKLIATERDPKKSLKKLRENKQIPAILYGKNIKSLPLSVDYLRFEDIYAEAGESTIIEIDSKGEIKNALIKDIQYDPVSSSIIHIDFYQINMKEEITANVELKFWVLPSGEVSSIEVFETSGWSGLDRLASETLRQWIFEPIEKDIIQWGIITFLFQLD